MDDALCRTVRLEPEEATFLSALCSRAGITLDQACSLGARLLLLELLAGENA